ncbi:MAG: exodeoxyribonuclease VII large subunit [Candidatus Marinimicrobia bacterium]|nr:exodeoxyribonuclease VII large subunit [Candidatus Neomarinimicrobiota bacterium]|tara:strand:+ start:1216 stop:2436 length:1221 start_codon:yes stop_codon:yes gene_type:complete
MVRFDTKFTVSELNNKLRSTLEGSFTNICVIGEISNFHQHSSSGHIYFTLKDGKSELKCVMFRGVNQFLRFVPEDGQNVHAYGSVSIFEQRGQVQLILTLMEPVGLGDLFQSFEALKKKLSLEGLFSDGNKLTIPKIPRSVGIITSSSGAALKDVINILGRRAPHVKIFLRDSKVQGQDAAKDIVESIKDLEKDGIVDTIIICRGGGSLEDLWAFNEEIVARAIYKCTIPIISAVGHETDFTISDLVSDLRAPTPSAGAELVSLSKDEILSQFFKKIVDMEHYLSIKINSLFQSIDHMENRMVLQRPSKQIQRNNEKLIQFSERLIHDINILLSKLKDKNRFIYKQLVNLGPKQIMNRGYTIALSEKGKVIVSASDIALGDHFKLLTGNGSFEAKKISNSQNDQRC